MGVLQVVRHCTHEALFPEMRSFDAIQEKNGDFG